MYDNRCEGSIEVITGPMFSGKSEEILKRFRLLNYAKKKVALIQPLDSSRDGNNRITSRAGVSADSFAFAKSEDILTLAKNENYDAFVIDEGQFFDAKLPEVASFLANQGKMVIISGLDQSYLRKPFINMALLMSLSEKITKLHAICNVCQRVATTTFRTAFNEEEKFIGDAESYEARCRFCHLEGEEEKAQLRAKKA